MLSHYLMHCIMQVLQHGTVGLWDKRRPKYAPQRSAAAFGKENSALSLQHVCSCWLSSTLLAGSGQIGSGIRHLASKAALKPKFVGGKMKVYSSYKERFKMSATGKIRYMRPGHRHKRFVKGSNRNRSLRKGKNLFNTYANTMKKLGFKMRTF
jgi:ribosomal protein L35